MIKILLIIISLFMAAEVFAQNSFSLSGGELTSGSAVSFEVNPYNRLLFKDWSLSLTFGGEFYNGVSSNLYSASIGKKLDRQGVIVRYTPGYQKDFVFRNGQSIIFGDSTSQNLESRFSYKEVFGFGYSFDFSKALTGGFNFRYFSEEFSTETLNPVISDTIYILRETAREKINKWRGDAGFIFKPADELSFSASSINLFTIGNNSLPEELKKYELKNVQAARFGVYYNPSVYFGSSFIYETNGALSAGVSSAFNLFEGIVSLGINLYGDKYQHPFISSVQPFAGFKAGLFDVTFSGVKYLKERTDNYSFAEFSREGISSIINNKYSYDKVILNVNFVLNTFKEKEVEFIDVEILSDIYPILQDNYLIRPYAKGKVVNLTEETLTVKPESIIRGLHYNPVQSQTVSIFPGDTSEVFFYTIIPELFSAEKTEIVTADFYLYAGDDEPDDEIQKPLLVNSINSWDGSVGNLKYFVKKDISSSGEKAKSIIRGYKTFLDTIPGMLADFYKSKIIFNEIVKDLVYASDPRATADYVQFPLQTIKLKGGDCDDLSVLYSSLLESIGIETALVDYRTGEEERHVNVMINTGLAPDQAGLITGNDKKYYIRADENGSLEIWIIVETTSLNNFEEAWELGSAKFQKEAVEDYGLAKGKVFINDIH